MDIREKSRITPYRNESSVSDDTTTWTYGEASNGIAAHYDYDVVGAVSRTAHNTRVTNRDIIHLNPYRFSSEVHDDTLGLVYYNYRHYAANSGRWTAYDFIEECSNLYSFLKNTAICTADILGLMEAKSWAIGRCARNVGNFNPEDIRLNIRVRSLTLEIYLRKWTHRYINKIFPDHHDVRVQAYPCEDCKGDPIETITRGFQANAFDEAIVDFFLSFVPFRSENGWVSGHVEDASSPGLCAMQCVSRERYSRVKDKIQQRVVII